MKSSRIEPRVRCVLPVRINWTDSEGNEFERLTCTLDISEHGARITGIPDKLCPGMAIQVSCKNRRGSFRVAWVGQKGTRMENQIGLLADAREAQFWRELSQEKSGTYVDGLAERERQAQQHARHIEPQPGSNRVRSLRVNDRLKAATEELFDLGKVIEEGNVEPTALREFRQALGYVRNTSWMLQQWFELEKNRNERLPLLTMLNTERLRLAASLCADLAGFVATTKVQLDVGLVDHFTDTIKQLMVVLRATSDRQVRSSSEPPADDTSAGTMRAISTSDST